MITIDQLLESVDLDFEPRWVTKDDDGEITIFLHRPTAEKWCSEWRAYEGDCKTFGELKLAEFEGKDWASCIYEVPRKTTGKLKHIERIDDSFVDKINTIIDAVNELKGAKNE